MLALARVARIFFSNLGGGRFHRKLHAIWVRFRLSNDQRQLRENSHFLIPSWPTSSSRPRKRLSPSRGSPSPSRPPPRRRRRRLLSRPSPPQSLLPPTAVPHACQLRAAACASIDKLTKLQLSSFIPTFHVFLSVISLQLSCNLGRKTRNYAMKFGCTPAQVCPTRPRLTSPHG